MASKSKARPKPLPQLTLPQLPLNPPALLREEPVDWQRCVGDDRICRHNARVPGDPSRIWQTPI